MIYLSVISGKLVCLYVWQQKHIQNFTTKSHEQFMNYVEEISSGSYLIDGLFTVLVLLRLFLWLLPLFDVIDKGEKVTQVQYNRLCLQEDN